MPGKISVIIPTFNESKIIVSTLARVADFFNLRNWPYEIILVDDSSVDNTVELVREIAENFKVKILENKINSGKGYSIKRGVEVAQGELVLFSDADLSTPIKEIAKLIKYIDDYDIVIGSRATADALVEKYQPWYKVISGKFGNLIIRLILGLRIRDTQCGFKLFRSDAFKIFDKQTIDRWGFDFELLFIAKKQGLRIKEVGVHWINNENSKVTILGYLKTLIEVFKVRLNSLRGKYS